jgi:hypothetical protein
VNTKNIVRLHRIGYTGEVEMVDGSILPVSKAQIAALSKTLRRISITKTDDS